MAAEHEAERIQCKLEHRQKDRDAKLETLKCLDGREREIRSHIIHRKGRFDLLRQSLDKLSFANQAYRNRKSIKSNTFEDETHYHVVKIRMLHGKRKSLAEERRLLREAKAPCRKIDTGSCSSFEALNSLIKDMNYSLGCTVSTNERNFQKLFAVDLKKLEMERETVIANAAVNGEIWRSLGSKTDVQSETQVIGREYEEARKGYLEVKAEIRRVRRELELIKEEMSYLQKQMTKLCSTRLREEGCLIYPSSIVILSIRAFQTNN